MFNVMVRAIQVDWESAACFEAISSDGSLSPLESARGLNRRHNKLHREVCQPPSARARVCERASSASCSCSAVSWLPVLGDPSFSPARMHRKQANRLLPATRLRLHVIQRNPKDRRHVGGQFGLTEQVCGVHHKHQVLRPSLAAPPPSLQPEDVIFQVGYVDVPCRRVESLHEALEAL